MAITRQYHKKVVIQFTVIVDRLLVITRSVLQRVSMKGINLSSFPSVAIGGQRVHSISVSFRVSCRI